MSIKLKLFTCLFCLLAILSVQAESSAPRVVPNASVAYLSALGWVPAFSDQVRKELEAVNSPAAAKILSNAAMEALSDEMTPRVAKLLSEAGRIPACRFVPDRDFLPGERLPPLEALWQLAVFARALGFREFAAGKHDRAFAIFRDIYQMGLALEQEAVFPAGLQSIRIRKTVLSAFKKLVSEAKEEAVQKKMAAYLENLSPSILSVSSFLATERRYIQNSLQMIKENPARVFPWLPDAVESSSDLSSDTSSADSQTTDKVGNFAGRQAFLDGGRQALSFIDEAVVMNPMDTDFQKRLNSLWERLNKENNPVIKTLIPQLPAIYDAFSKLDNEVSSLQKMLQQVTE